MDQSPAPIVVESLRPGTFVDTAGKPHTFTREDLAQLAAAYDPAAAPSPVVIGHPKTNDPAWGWIAGAEVGDDDKLRVRLGDVDPEFAALVREKKYRKVSLALFAPGSPGNPKPAQWYIRHLGYLGAAAPAVTGLKPAEFAGPDEGIVEFADWSDVANAGLWRSLRDWFIGRFGLEEADKAVPAYQVSSLEDEARRPESDPESIPGGFAAPTLETPAVTEEEAARLRAQNADLSARLEAADRAAREAQRIARHEEHVTFAASLTGRVPPAEHGRVVAVLDALAGIEAPVEFAAADGNTVSEAPANALRAVLAALPTVVPEGEAAAANKGEDTGVAFAAPAGYQVDAERLALHQKAEAHARSHNVPYEQALAAVLGQ